MRWTTLSAVLLLGAVASSQVPTGTLLRPMQLGEVHNSEASVFADFTGRLVLIELFAYW